MTIGISDSRCCSFQNLFQESFSCWIISLFQINVYLQRINTFPSSSPVAAGCGFSANNPESCSPFFSRYLGTPTHSMIVVDLGNYRVGMSFI